MRIAPLAFLLVGCVAYNGPSDDDDTGSGVGSGGGSGTGSGSGSGSGSGVVPPPPTVASGAYHVRSEIDLTVEALLPETAEEIVRDAARLLDEPCAHAVRPRGGCRRAGDERPARCLPTSSKQARGLDQRRDREAHVKRHADHAVLAGNIAALAETALTQFALESELTIASGTRRIR